MLNATPLVCLRAGADETVAYAVSGAMSAWQSEWRSQQQHTIRHFVCPVCGRSFDAAPAPVTYHEAFPRVVGSLPPGEVFAAPVFDQVHQEQLAAGEIPENMVVIPVVREQVIFPAIPRVVGSLPPVAESTEPVYYPIHQEQFSAGETTAIIANIPVVQETTANIANIPVVQEQVLVQAIPRVVGSLPPVAEFTACVARRPPPLVEVRPSVGAQRHVAEQLADIAPMVQILDSPEPQIVAQLLEVFRLLDTQLPDEQAISVPKISCSSCPSRSRVPEPQSAD